MNIASLANERAFAEIKRLCLMGLDAAALRRRVTEQLRRAVPFEAYVAFTMDPSNGLITHALQTIGDERGLRVFLERVFFEDDVLEFTWMAKNRLPVGLLSEATAGRLERAPRYRELVGREGYGYELRGVLGTGTQVWGGLALWRAKGRPDFTAREVAFVRRVVPHLGAGLRAAALKQEVQVSEDGDDDAAGILVLDARGTVLQYNAAAERRLRELGDLGPRWREGEGLPAALWTVLGALKRALKPDTDRDLDSTPSTRIRASSGRWLTLQASSTEPGPSRPSESVVILAPTAPKEILRLTAVGYGLSRREEEVVDLAIRGASTKAISRTLHISEHTVKDHLSNVFAKVGVRGRRALVKQLYLNTIFR
jgi:DNA-binding CsgD family transcriptional regulator